MPQSLFLLLPLWLTAPHPAQEPAGAAEPAHTLTWRGCGISKKAFMAHAAKVYEAETGVRVVLSGGGASLGIQAAGEGAADFGGTCRHCLESGFESKLPVALTQVAWDALAVIVHPDNPVHGLTREQLVAILNGQIRNWSEVGGENLPILVVARKGKTSGVGFMVRAQILRDPDFEFGPRSLRLQSSGPVEKLVEKSRAAIAVTGVSSARLRSLKLLALDGAAPSASAIASGDYPYYRPLYLAHAPQLGEQQQRFRDWLLSERGQAAVAASGTVTLAAGVRLTGAFEHYGDVSRITNFEALQEAWLAWRARQEERP